MLKRILLVALALAALMALLPAQAEPGGPDEQDEWTVLFYLCGSDLESKYGYATSNLEEIAQVSYLDNLYESSLKARGLAVNEDSLKSVGRVNVLIETGGSLEWHAQALGMDIDPTALQRWSCNINSIFRPDGKSFTGEEEDRPDDGYELLETLPLQSMADPQTLSDFIRWGVETRPAKKYALVLWDHGDGARTGLFIDELFDKDIMYLYELREALEDGGAHFEAVIIDACLMANIETAWNLKDYADWLAASEEIVPGEGTAIGEWLQELLIYPECDGEWLCRQVCDTTSVKYADEASEEANAILTWSVIDLKKVDALIEIAGRFFKMMGNVLRNDAEMSGIYMSFVAGAPEYGDGEQQMRDFGGVIYNSDLVVMGQRSLRNEAVQALSDAVVYSVHGQGRSEARGLTFCYPAGFTDESLDLYAKNFPMSDYLAYLDAVSDWTAPDWVYESADRLPEINDVEEFQIKAQKRPSKDGMPGLRLSDNALSYTDWMSYTLYRVNEETGETVRLGRTNCIPELSDDGNYELIWRAADPMHWPTVEGELICMDLIQTTYSMKLYNVPVMLNSQPSLLRLGRHVNYAEDEAEKINEYEIYGLWEGYEEDSALLNRSVRPLSSIMGQEYQLLYPIDGTGGSASTLYESSAPLTMYRSLDVQELPLPAGTYYLEYEIEDVFMRWTVLDRIEIHWDGKNMTFPSGDSWESDEWINLTALRER